MVNPHMAIAMAMAGKQKKIEVWRELRRHKGAVYYDGYETPVYCTGHVTTLTYSKIGGFWLALRWLRGVVCITIVT
jgi:hypothetical protein